MKVNPEGSLTQRDCHEACLYLAEATGARCEPANQLSLLNGGEVFVPAMLAAIAGASETVDLELFRAHPGQLWTLLKAALQAASARGNRVRVIVDAIGSRGMNSREWRYIADAGVLFRTFRPIRLSSPILSTRRNHRKILIVDGRAAFTGGMSFDDVFYRNPDGPTWREAMVQIGVLSFLRFRRGLIRAGRRFPSAVSMMWLFIGQRHSVKRAPSLFALPRRRLTQGRFSCLR